jgi:hypothetical protein
MSQMHSPVTVTSKKKYLEQKMWLWVDVSLTRGARMHTCIPASRPVAFCRYATFAKDPARLKLDVRCIEPLPSPNRKGEGTHRDWNPKPSLPPPDSSFQVRSRDRHDAPGSGAHNSWHQLIDREGWIVGDYYYWDYSAGALVQFALRAWVSEWVDTANEMVSGYSQQAKDEVSLSVAASSSSACRPSCIVALHSCFIAASVTAVVPQS